MENGNTCSDLPPGFRFHPTDEELIMCYLKNQATSMPCPASVIPEVDIYKFDPWQLPEKAEFGEKEWYFFTPRDRKYPNGARPNRATVSGYWKATGTDKAIYSGSKYVGVKKALVFYKGRPPKGVKSDWIMHEYRLTDLIKKQTNRQPGSMRLDDWVLCRIYNKKNNIKSNPNLDKNLRDGSMLDDKTSTIGSINNEEQIMMEMKPTMMPRTNSLAHLFDLDYWGPLSHLLPDGHSYNHPNVFDHQYYQTPMDNAGGSDQKWKPNGDQNHNWMKLEVNENNGASHVFPTFSNVHKFQ